MEMELTTRLAAPLRDFHLPDYDQLPDVGLYLDQVTRYLSDQLAPLESITLTSSMVSNYVKKGLIASPVKKQYDREQIAYLMFIAVAKTVLSLEDISLFIAQQKRTYSSEVAYNYFCQEFENVLRFVFGLKDTLDEVGSEQSREKVMLRTTIITAAHKLYLDSYFAALHEKTGD